MSYAKLFSSITESSLWSEPVEVRVLFVSMLARADAAGFMEASVPGLARMANLTEDQTERALEALEGPDPHSKNPEHEGRRLLRVPGGWMLLNYEDYRNRRSEEERREYMRKYMSEYRKQRKQFVNIVSRGKPQLAQAEAEAEAEAEAKRETPKPPNAVDALVARWNATTGAVPIRKLTAKRRAALKARLADAEWDWQAALAKFPLKCFAADAGGYTPTFDFFLRPETVNAILEGKYDWSKANGTPSPARAIGGLDDPE